jgi:hypothetical protein
MSKFLCSAGALMMFAAMCGVEGGGLNLTAGAVLGAAGAVLMLATMKSTGWFYA